jgi:hypothetical protein
LPTNAIRSPPLFSFYLIKTHDRRGDRSFRIWGAENMQYENF